MKLYFKGHDYKYAAEQMLLTLFPGQRPEYPASPPAAGEDALELSLFRGRVWATATARLSYRGKRCAAVRRCSSAELTGGLADSRALQRILKLAFYDAGVRALGREPPWGALTGVRPVKIPTRAMAQGASPAPGRRRCCGTPTGCPPPGAQLAMDCAQASLAAQNTLRPDEVSLYVGIPFCPTRCAYCSFVSADVGRALKLIDPFLAALHREISAAGAAAGAAGLYCPHRLLRGRHPHHPGSAHQLEPAAGRRWRTTSTCARCTEYTVEAGRPDTITAEKLAVLRGAGSDRVSVNPQTMEDEVLAAMGRAHTAADIRRAYELVRLLGIPCVNMDLIAGLPGDSAEGFCASLEQVLALGPENVTVHTLALKKGSRLMEEGRALLPTGGGRWPPCWTTPGPPCAQPGRSPTTSTGRSICPAPLKMWAGAGPAPRACTTSA